MGRKSLFAALAEFEGAEPVGCEFLVKRQRGSGKDRDNAAATRDDQAMLEQVTMRLRVVRASCH